MKIVDANPLSSRIYIGPMLAKNTPIGPPPIPPFIIDERFPYSDGGLMVVSGGLWTTYRTNSLPNPDPQAIQVKSHVAEPKNDNIGTSEAVFAVYNGNLTRFNPFLPYFMEMDIEGTSGGPSNISNSIQYQFETALPLPYLALVNFYEGIADITASPSPNWFAQANRRTGSFPLFFRVNTGIVAGGQVLTFRMEINATRLGTFKVQGATQFTFQYPAANGNKGLVFQLVTFQDGTNFNKYRISRFFLRQDFP